MKKSLVVVLLLALSLVFTLSASAFANDMNVNEAIVDNIDIESNDAGIIPFRYSLIKTISASLDIKDNTANCTGRVTTPEEVYKIQITMTLQKYSGGDWIEHTTWSRTVYNTDDFILSKPSTVGKMCIRDRLRAGR